MRMSKGPGTPFGLPFHGGATLLMASYGRFRTPVRQKPQSPFFPLPFLMQLAMGVFATAGLHPINTVSDYLFQRKRDPSFFFPLLCLSGTKPPQSRKAFGQAPDPSPQFSRFIGRRLPNGALRHLEAICLFGLFELHGQTGFAPLPGSRGLFSSPANCSGQ